jgi:hypothetical protein
MDVENQAIVVPEKDIYVIKNSYALHVTRFKPENHVIEIYSAIPVFMCLLTIIFIVIFIVIFIYIYFLKI